MGAERPPSDEQNNGHIYPAPAIADGTESTTSATVCGWNDQFDVIKA